MISKVGAKRSNDPGALVRYLFGPGKANEHVNQRTVAGSVHYPGTGATCATQVAADLRAPQRLWPDVKFPGGHVWHCSLALGPQDGALSDAKWAAIADDFMREMGIADPAKAAVRWAAVHHGPSDGGNDHVHLVANLIREDGTKVNIWQDMVRSQKIVHQLEHDHGLQILQTRSAAAGASNVPYTPGEAARARESGRPVDRVELERIVRSVASAAMDEPEFVRRLRGAGVIARAYPPSGKVTGYSVGLPAGEGERIRYLQGGKLARDLTLPRLRLAWAQTAESLAAAQLEWRRGAPGKPVVRSPREVTGIPFTPDALARALEELQQLSHQLQDASPEQFAGLSQDVAGTLAAAAGAAAPEVGPSLRKASREVAAWAGTRTALPRRRRLGGSAALLFLQAMNPGSQWAQAYMLRQLMDAVMELHQLHRASRSAVLSTPGGSVRMSSAHDDVDGVFSDALTVAATTGATVAAAHAARRREQIEAARRAGKPAAQRGWRNAFQFDRGRDSWSPGRPGQAATPVPKGMEPWLPPSRWEGMPAEQQRLVDPDKVGRWPTDYYQGTPGAELRATADQMCRAGLLGDALGHSGKGAEVANLTRGRAAEMLRYLESELGPEKTKDTYLAAALPYRSEVRSGNGTTYDLHFQAPLNSKVAAPPAPALTPAASAPAAPATPPPTQRVPVLNDPTTWATAGEPVRPKQAAALRGYGHDLREIALLDKGHASLVLQAHDTGGDEAGHDAMDRALAAMEASRPVGPRNGPNPTPNGPTRSI